MTDLAIISDLHQEMLRLRDASISEHPLTAFDPDKEMTESFDILLIPGDVEVPLTRSLNWIHERFPGETVLYVPGNHDFYQDDDDLSGGDRYTLRDQQDRGRELADKFGIHLLMNDTVEFDDVRFIGGTLWTDMATVGRGLVHGKLREAEGKRGMNDYSVIKRRSAKDPTKFRPLRAAQTVDEFKATRSFIEAELETPFDGETVVLTHHAPHEQSLRDGPLAPLAHCYASNLSSIMESDFAPSLWVHGHIHGSKDYEIGNTRVISNARGHGWKGQLEHGFDADLRIEVGYTPELTP